MSDYIKKKCKYCIEEDRMWTPKEGYVGYNETVVRAIRGCDTCKHKDEDWQSEACDGCCLANSNYERSE